MESLSDESKSENINSSSSVEADSVEAEEVSVALRLLLPGSDDEDRSAVVVVAAVAVLSSSVIASCLCIVSMVNYILLFGSLNRSFLPWSVNPVCSVPTFSGFAQKS